jgi:hypothetical protein
MSGESLQVVVFQDAAGDYYVVPQQVWDQARVPRQHREEVERLVGGGGATAAGKVRDLEIKPGKAGTVRGGAISQVGTFQAPTKLNYTPSAGSTWSGSA